MKIIKKFLFLAACIFVSNQAWADDSVPTVPSGGTGTAIHTSCGIWTYAPGFDYIITTGTLVEFFSDINEEYCGTRSGWYVIYQNVTYDEYAVRVYEGKLDPTV